MGEDLDKSITDHTSNSELEDTDCASWFGGGIGIGMVIGFFVQMGLILCLKYFSVNPKDLCNRNRNRRYKLAPRNRSVVIVNNMGNDVEDDMENVDVEMIDDDLDDYRTTYNNNTARF